MRGKTATTLEKEGRGGLMGRDSGMLGQFFSGVESGDLKLGGLGGFIAGDAGSEMHQFTLHGRKDGGAVIRLGMFTSLRGGGVFGAEAFLRLIRLAKEEVELLQGYKVQFHLFCGGAEAEEEREEARGWLGLTAAELGLLDREVASNRFHGIVVMHADEASEGIYGYAGGGVIQDELLVPALEAAGAKVKVSKKDKLADFDLEDGCIIEGCEGMLGPDLCVPLPFELSIGMPSGAAFESKAEAALIALRVILQRYRPMLSMANDI